MARILIVEDESLIAWMLAEWIFELGHTAVGPAASVAAALALIADEPVDAAIVDLHLHGEICVAVTMALADKQIPFAVASGDNDIARSHFAHQPLMSKPYLFADVQRIVSGLAGANRELADHDPR